MPGRKLGGDIESVPKSCNVQAYFVVQAFLEICEPKGRIDDNMLEKFVLNLRLLTETYQDIKRSVCRPLFMKWQYPEWHEGEFDYWRDNTLFNWWLQDCNTTPECMNFMQGHHYGIWQPAYDAKLLVTVIVRMPITDGSYFNISHLDVIERFV